MATIAENHTYPELARGESSQGSVDEKQQHKVEADHEKVHDGEYDLDSHDM